MAQEQYVNLGGLRVERYKPKYYFNNVGGAPIIQASGDTGHERQLKEMGYTEITPEQASVQANQYYSSGQFADPNKLQALQKQISDVYHQGTVLTPENLKQQVGADTTSIQNVTDLLKGVNMASDSNYKNIGTANTPLYIPKGSAAEANLKNPINVLNQPTNPVSSNQQPVSTDQSKINIYQPVTQDKILASFSPTTPQNTTQSLQGKIVVPQTAIKKSFPTIALQPGATGNEVKQLQDYLVSQGVMTQEQVNTGYGTYGPQTTAAVLALQKKLGVDYSSGSGYWGPKTLAAVQGGTNIPQTPITLAGGQSGAISSVPAASQPAAILSPLENSLMKTQGYTAEQLKDPAFIQSQISQITDNIQTLQAGKEKEDAILDFVKMAAGAGIPFDNIQNYMAYLTTPAKSEEEIRQEVYKKYGIGDLETKAYATPAETFEQIYKRVMTDSKVYVDGQEKTMADAKTALSAVQAEIDQATADYNKVVSDIKANPWKSEAGISSGTIAKATEMYNRTLTRLNAKQMVLTNNIQRAENRATFLSQKISTEAEKAQQLTQKELSYYITRAKADIEAQATLQEDKTAKELYRYYPQYFKAYKKETTAAEKIMIKEQAEISRVKNKLTNYGQRDYVSEGYYNQVKATSTLSPSKFDGRFKSLIKGTRTVFGTASEKSQARGWLIQQKGVTQTDLDKLNTDETFFYWALNKSKKF